MAQIIKLSVPPKQLESDLEKLRQRAIELGATDAKVINATTVVLDERVIAKCAYPKCPSYGTNANCPPHAMSVDQARKVIEKFQYAILVKIDVPCAHTAGKEAVEKNLVQPYRMKMAEIIARLEGEAFYKGYYLALGFGAGSCKSFFCPDNDCYVLKTGKGCPHRLKARSAMEAVGIDVYATVTKAGWDIYPIGDNTPSEAVPYGLRVGIVFIY